jgi:hypothetical protein
MAGSLRQEEFRTEYRTSLLPASHHDSFEGYEAAKSQAGIDLAGVFPMTILEDHL